MDAWLGWCSTISGGVMRAIDSAIPVQDHTAVSSKICSTTLDKVMVGAASNRAVEVQHLRILGERITAVSAEPLLGLRNLCQNASLLVGYSRDVFGYWPLEMDIGLGGYEVNGFKKRFGVPYEWQPGLDLIFCDLVAGPQGRQP